MTKHISILILTVVATFSSSVFSQTITYQYSGVVANPGSGEILGMAVNLGDSVSGTFQYDVNSEDTSGFPDFGIFEQDIASGFTVSIGDVDLSADEYDIVISTFELSIQNIAVQEVAALSGLSFSEFSNPVFPTIALPDDTLTESDFSVLTGFVDTAPFFQDSILLDILELSSASDTLLGDVNLDGKVDLLDIAPFVDLLVNGGFQLEADLNQDGAVSLLDVAPFVDAIAS